MSYTPKNWQKGDKILASNMNNIEQGVADMSDGYTPKTWVKGDKIMASDMNHIEQGIADGGGIPNNKEVWTGTMADVFTNMPIEKYTALYNGLINGDASAQIVIDASALGMETYYQVLQARATSVLYTTSAAVNPLSCLANEIGWTSPSSDNPAELQFADMFQDGTYTDMLPYASYVTATVTIYWHPMPSTT